MKEYLFLLHFTVGVIQTRKALQAVGMTFRISGIPRGLRGGCGLCICLTRPPGEEIQQMTPGHTESVYCRQDGGWRCTAHYGISSRQGFIKTAMYTSRYFTDLP